MFRLFSRLFEKKYTIFYVGTYNQCYDSIIFLSFNLSTEKLNNALPKKLRIDFKTKYLCDEFRRRQAHSLFHENGGMDAMYDVEAVKLDHQRYINILFR